MGRSYGGLEKGRAAVGSIMKASSMKEMQACSAVDTEISEVTRGKRDPTRSRTASA